MASGVIFDIKEFALYDGPGVRETVFFKGCPLRCTWCHNPEGLSFRKELSVAKASCTECGKCRAVCPSAQACMLCGTCVAVCPLALRKICGEDLTAKALAERLLSHADYYAALSGGVTFSGGEPLLQHEFLFEVLDLLCGYHRAVETCGYAKSDVFADLLSRCELVIMDIKLTDSTLHKTYTGVDNSLILENYRTLRKSGLPHIIRTPLIPGVSDTEENIEALAAFLKGDEALVRLELLPYHKTAGAKYQNVGKSYAPPFDTEKEPIIHREILDKEKIGYTIL